MEHALQILIVSDNKPGHYNQSLGLAEAISRLHPAHIHTWEVAQPHLLWKFTPLGKPLVTPSTTPNLLIGAGHATHLSLLRLACRTGSPCVVLMKPTLPTRLFDLCLIPQHDFHRPNHNSHILTTYGALNRIPPPDGTARRGGLILLGGPSKNHGWDEAHIFDCLSKILTTREDVAWKITDSRRTPPGILDKLRQSFPNLSIHPHTETGRDWLPGELAKADEIWVSEDSVSMVYEALSSGARVGLLPVPVIDEKNRLVTALAQLVSENLATRFDGWQPGTRLAEPTRILRESDRCAKLVLKKLLPYALPA